MTDIRVLPYLGVRYQVKYHKCNLACPYCIAAWSERENVFDAVTFRQVVSKLKQLPYRISLRIGVGGEFFTCPELMEEVRNICNFDTNIFGVSFSTNLVASWNQTIGPFLSSLDTGKLGMGCTLHDTVIKDIDEFFDKASKIKKAGVEVYVGYVAIPQKINLIPAYKKRCDQLGIPLIMNGLIGKLRGVDGADPSLEYPRDYTSAELAALKEVWDTPHSYMMLLRACNTKGMACSAGRNYIYIDHRGNVFPCGNTAQLKASKNMGNILTDEIMMQTDDTRCPFTSCWCGNENQALRIVDQYYERSRALRVYHQKTDIPKSQLYQGYNPSIFDRSFKDKIGSSWKRVGKFLGKSCNEALSKAKK